MGLASFKSIHHFKKTWKIWDIRILILSSFVLQIFLIISAPLRKRTSKGFIIVPVWMAYLLADAIANFAVGVISKAQSQDETDTSSFSVHPDLLALWASLLLVHLGGPDTITAFAMEDNELWLRHLLQLAYQGATTGYIFIVTLPVSKLRLPTLLMFICGMKKSEVWRWVLGLTYIVAVAAIWIAASYVVQSVVDGDKGVSPFLITYICNSLFIVYVPIVEIVHYLEDTYGSVFFWRGRKPSILQELKEYCEEAVLLDETNTDVVLGDGSILLALEEGESITHQEIHHVEHHPISEEANKGLDAKGRWTRARVAKVSLLICPFWFLAQLSFNLSLKYTSVTSNTILSTSSSLFTFLVALVFSGEKFSWVKLASVLLCMGGAVVVSLGDSTNGSSATASNPVAGDVFALASAAFYAVYITLIRLKLNDDDGKNGRISTAQFLGYLGLFNLLIFLPVALILDFTKWEPFRNVTKEKLGLIVGKGLLDNVLSDYLWAKAVLLTTTTVATAGLTIQVPLAALVDSLMGTAPKLTDYIGAAAVMFGFVGINIPSDVFVKPNEEEEATLELESGDPSSIAI